MPAEPPTDGAESGYHADHDRVLATLLMTDIVGSTERAARVDARGWRDVLARRAGRRGRLTAADWSDRLPPRHGKRHVASSHG